MPLGVKNQPNLIVDRFMQITAIPAVSLKERVIIDYLKKWLSDRNFTFIEDSAGEKNGGNAGNLICKVPANTNSTVTLLLSAHVDTVSDSCANPVIDDGKVISSDPHILGADDRAGVNVLLEILQRVADRKIQHPNLEIVFCVAEEIGLQGSRYLDYSLLSARHGINFDSSSPVGKVIVSAPNKVEFTIKITGQEAHAAIAPDKGVSAILAAAQVITALNQWQKPGDTVFNIGTVTGGGHTNVIPGKVLLHGEMRSFSRATIDENLARMDEIIARESSAAGTTYQFEHILKYSDFNLAPESVAYQLSCAAITGLEVPFEPIRTFGGSDANNYNKHNIATVNLGMGYVNNHSHKEYISVDDLVLSAEIGVRIVELAAKFGTQSGK